MRLGFAMYTAALNNEGVIDRATLYMDHVAQIFTPYTTDEAIVAIDALLAGSPERHRVLGATKEMKGFEKWSFNPLSSLPIVQLTDHRYVMPSPRLLLDRITPTGLYYIAAERYGDRFTNSLGKLFESYIGAQLALLQHATVGFEIAYGRSNEKKTVDYFIVTPEVVILVEVKACRPTVANGVEATPKVTTTWSRRSAGRMNRSTSQPS